jgi:DNA-binding NtrC family response regulator
VGNTRNRILVVDDKEYIRTTTTLVLEEMGYIARSAEDGIAALREIRKEEPDILLSDLNMPGMSGFELLMEVRRSFPSIQVIAMSGAFFGAGMPVNVLADAFYQKGSGVSALLQILRALPEMRLSTYEPCRTAGPGRLIAREPSLARK